MGDEDIRNLTDLIIEILEEFSLGDFTNEAGRNRIAAVIESQIRDTLSENNLYDVTA